MDRLFKPFSQADSSTTRNFRGTGLGLAICKRLSEAMGGDISVTSEPNQGSCFAFHIDAPWAESPIVALSEANESPAAAAKNPADNPAILIVDDNPINRKVLGSILRVSGYERVEYAFDGAQALAAARRSLSDIIFMDVEMPVMDSMTATTEIRRLMTTTAQHPWIIGLSANVWPDTVRRSGEVGMNNSLVKPVRRSDVEAAIGERL